MNDFCTIPLSRGRVALVSPHRYAELSKFEWYCTANGKAVRDVYLGGGKAAPITINVHMHRQIMGLGLPVEDPRVVDHINGNGLDNRDENLRICTQAENMRNVKPRTGTSSRFKGVSWHRAARKWEAYVNLKGRRYNLHLYEHEEDAARAYDRKAIELFGEFARTNFPMESYV